MFWIIGIALLIFVPPIFSFPIIGLMFGGGVGLAIGLFLGFFAQAAFSG